MMIKSFYNLVSEVKKVSVVVSAKYSDYIGVSSLDSTVVVLPKYTGIKDYPIDLVDNKQLPYDFSNHLLAL